MGTPETAAAPFVQPATLVWVAGLLAFAATAVWGLLLLRSRARLRRHLEVANTQLDALRGRDPLTGLMTRPEFEDAVDDAVLVSDRGHTPLALLYVALDNFRPLNDGYGPRVGDAVLVQAGQRLQQCLDGTLAVSRLGGDEFALLVSGLTTGAAEAAGRVLAALQTPYDCEGLELRLTASVGIAVYPDHGSRPRLLGHAGLAMRSVKQVGGDGHAVYDPAMAVDQRDQADLLQDLSHALERGQLQLYYQPKIDARSLQVTAAEALLRWQHPKRGTISPAVFIPLAERHGLIGRIGHWVIEEACRQAAQWREAGLRMRVAVNISGHQLRQDDLVQHILATLTLHGIPPGRLTCEITETVAMEDTAHTRQAMERLRRAGLHVSIDDFGTGHSSLASLRRMPAAELKIDRAFVADLAAGAHARSIVQAVVQMAATLGLRVVAEGVETEAQRDALVALGCDELQGYLFAKPMTATALMLWADGDDTQTGSAAMFRPSLFEPTAVDSLID
jgi:diguanylate cyclase (GGDEF)-like protein